MGCPFSKTSGDGYSDSATSMANNRHSACYNYSPHFVQADRKLKDLFAHKTLVNNTSPKILDHGTVKSNVIRQNVYHQNNQQPSYQNNGCLVVTNGFHSPQVNYYACGSDTPNNTGRTTAARTQHGATDTLMTRLSRRIKPRQLDIRVVNNYNVKTVIGKGSFSRVVLAEHRSSGTPVAIKLIPAKEGTGHTFENELKILAQLKHPHIIRLIEVYRSTSRIYMVMELATGGELYDRIVAKGSYNEKETALTLRMLLEGISYLHRNGVTHRDLKPENLLYLNQGLESKLIITDFGLAHQRRSNDDPYMMDPCGTPEYIAPEILARIPYTCKVDLWAVGVIAYILLSGTMPFDDENRTVMYRHILRGRYHFHYEYWCNVSDEAKEYVASLLTVDPNQRPTAELAQLHPWIQNALYVQDRPPPKMLQKSRSLDPTKQHRSRSNRSIRSIARSDAGHRVDKREVDKLHKDPEVQKILHTNNKPIVTNYGLI